MTPTMLKEGAEQLAWRLQHLKRPYVSVLIGGSNNVYRLDAETMQSFALRLGASALALEREPDHHAVAPHRRSQPRNPEGHARRCAALSVDGEGDNPYFGLLGLADFIVVTADSVNMVSEAASTGKPVYVVPLPGGSPKFEAFHQRLIDDGVTRVFDKKLEPYAYRPARRRRPRRPARSRAAQARRLMQIAAHTS